LTVSFSFFMWQMGMPRCPSLIVCLSVPCPRPLTSLHKCGTQDEEVYLSFIRLCQSHQDRYLSPPTCFRSILSQARCAPEITCLFTKTLTCSVLQ
jgi:hypothetical protein